MAGDLAKRKIAVIGAGWTGIGCFVQLKAAGHEVHVFDELDDVGGTWHPNNRYPGLRIHAPAAQIEYHDYPLPETVDPTARISSAQVFDYVSAYARSKGLYENAHFQRRIVLVEYDSAARKMVLTVEDPSGEAEAMAFDYVVYTSGYTHRDIPAFAGKEDFAGRIVHSFAAKEELVLDAVNAGERIVVLGGGKTATDFVLYFESIGAKITWLYRKNYWFTRFEPLQRGVGLVRKQRAAQRGADRTGHRGRIANRVVGWIFGRRRWRIFPPGLLWFLVSRIARRLHTYGPRHSDYRRFHGGILDDHQVKKLRRYNAQYGVQGEVERLDANALVLTDGRKLDADLVICCTGSGANSGNMVEVRIDGERVDLSTQRKIYRHRVLPAMPNLIFTAFSAFSFGTINGLSIGNWIKTYIERDPSSAYLEENATTTDNPVFEEMTLFGSRKPLFEAWSDDTRAILENGELSHEVWEAHKVGGFVGNSTPLEFNPPGESDS